VPFVPVPFGTRNHFSRDAGFDVDDPVGALAAFGGECERRVDVGVVGERVFLNNVSLGLYASFVHDPERRTKNRLVAFARMFKAGVAPTRRPLDLRFEVQGNAERHLALVCLVAANDYDVRSISDLRAREHLDDGWLHAYVIEATTPLRLVALLARAAVGRVVEADGWAEYTSRSFSIESPRRRIHAALDGEPVFLPPRLDFEIRPRALRVLLPPGSRDGEEGDAARR
jgi:diacylglycerol kinase family enzyme